MVIVGQPVQVGVVTRNLIYLKIRSPDGLNAVIIGGFAKYISKGNFI
jgi:hypothetical protein